MITLKQESTEFTRMLGMKIAGNEKFRKIFEVLRTKKSANVLSLVEILDNAGGELSIIDKGVIGGYIKDFSSTEMLQDIQTIVAKYLNNLDDYETLEKMIDLNNVIVKALNKLDASNDYADKLKKYLGGSVVKFMKSDRVDILEIAENNKLMKKLESFL